MSVASYQSLTVQQGATLDTVFTWYASDGVTPINLTGYTVTFHILKSDGTILDWSSYCTLGGSAGTTTLLVPASVTNGYAAQYLGYYDLVLTAGDGVTKYRVWEGTVWVELSTG